MVVARVIDITDVIMDFLNFIDCLLMRPFFFEGIPVAYFFLTRDSYLIISCRDCFGTCYLFSCKSDILPDNSVLMANLFPLPGLLKSIINSSIRYM